MKNRHRIPPATVCVICKIDAKQAMRIRGTFDRSSSQGLQNIYYPDGYPYWIHIIHKFFT